MKNKVKVLIIIIVLLLVVLGIYLFSNKEKTYENVRIIGELFDGGEVSKIIYNNKDYVISEDDNIYSIKSYNGKLYYYRSIGLNNYFIYEEEIDNKTGFFYQFGQLVLNEKDSTYSMETIKQVSYEEYNTGNKDKIEYCIENIEGKYGFEINRVTIIEVEDDITIEKVWEDEEDYKFKLVYTKKDENNNVKWKYNTECAIEGQYDVIGTLGFTDDRIYINENGTIVVINRETGEVIWRSEACKETEGAIDSRYIDENENLYIYRGDLTVIDKNGKTIANITDDILSGDGIGVYPVNDKELLLSGLNGYLVINLEKFNIEYKIVEESKDVENEYSVIYTKKDKDNNTIWAYETQKVHNTELNTVEFLSIVGNNIYINESGIITALDIETGKVIWQNAEYKGATSSFCVDENNNLYISGYYEPFLHIIDENGKTIKRIDPFDDNFKGPGDIYLRNNNELVINCSINAEEIRAVVNLKDYSIRYENIEE